MSPRPAAPFAALAALALLGLLLWPAVGVAPTTPPQQPDGPAPAAAAGAPAAATEQGTRGDVRLPAPPASTLVLTVIDADSAQPLPAAEIAWSSSEVRGRAATGSDGTAFVCPRPTGPCELTIHHTGHVPLHATLPAIEYQPTIALERAGELTVTVRDSDGAPMPGVAIALLPPRLVGRGFGDDFARFAGGDEANTPGPWGIVLPELVLVDGVFRIPDEPVGPDRQWHVSSRWHTMARQQTTGEDGAATWTGLPAGAGYRFGFLPPQQGRTDPPHEQQRLTPGPAGVTVGRAPPSNLSGTFAITAGERTDVAGTILCAGSVRGRMLTPPGTRAPARLLAITQAGGGDISPVIALDVADCQPTDDAGNFAFEHVRPGDYALRTRWIEGGRDVHFISITLRVPPGGDIDLGSLAATSGHTVEVAIGLQTADAREVSNDRVFADPAHAVAVLMLSALPANGTLADALNDVSVVSVGVPITFHGLPAGRVHVTAQPADGITTVASVARLQASTTLATALPRTGPVRPCLQVEFGNRIEFAFQGEDGTPRHPPLLWSRRRFDGRIDCHELPTGAPSIGLPDGDYDLFLAMPSGDDTTCAAATLSVPRPDAPLAIELQAAATVQGRLVDAVGRPVADRLLRWTLPGWASDHAPWLFVATTDAAGRFVLEGVPAGMVVQPASDAPPLPMLSHGRNAVVLATP